MATDQSSQQLPPNPAAQQLQPVGGPPPPISAAGPIVDTLQCQWTNPPCGERAPTAEALYEHVCERHVGRKSTNNLSLTCAWGSCHTTTVKRDHITSHIRVHVPLKPHKCDFCGKSFKRPQDLKKHVKTHAEETQFPSPDRAGPSRHPPNGNYGNMTGQPRPGFYGDGGMQSNVPISYAYQGSTANNQGYYAPTQQPLPGTYGNVFYSNVNTGQDMGNHASYESRKRGLDTTNEFFGALKHRTFNAGSYADISSQLATLQPHQLPIILGEYQQTAQLVGNHGGGGIALAHTPYTLPSLSNLRTKGDVDNAERILAQMHTTTLENSAYRANEALSISNLIPRDPHHSSSGRLLRQSPPHSALHSSHNVSPPSQVSPHGSHAGTPELTPGSSAMSYSSNSNSPISVASNHVPVLPASGASMYPTLPSVSSGPAGTASTSTLGALYDETYRRRHGGGTLHRAQPAPHEAFKQQHEDDMDLDVEMVAAHAHGVEKLRKVSHHLIDPALAGDVTMSSSSASTTPHAPSSAAGDASTWLENARIIDALKSFVGMMKGEMIKMEMDGELKHGPESLYPILKHE